MLASDMNNPNFVGATNPDDILHVTFYMRSLQNEFESEKQGRPIFYETVFVRIMSPGNQISIVDTPATREHELRFPRQWAMFKNSQTTEQVVGTPVEEWPAVTRSQAEELKGIKFFTVEQIAAASDLQIQRLGMNAMMLRQKAQAFIMAAKDRALEQKQAIDIARKDQEIADLKNGNKRLSDQMEEIMRRFDNIDKPKRKYTKREKEQVEREKEFIELNV